MIQCLPRAERGLAVGPCYPLRRTIRACESISAIGEKNAESMQTLGVTSYELGVL